MSPVEQTFRTCGDRRRWLQLALWGGVLAVLLAAHRQAGAQPAAAESSPEDIAYRDAITSAVQHFKEQKWRDAIAAFERAHAIRPSAQTARGIGLASYEDGQYARALQYLRLALRDSRNPLDAAQQAEARTWAERAEGLIFRLRLSVAPESASMRIDGKPADLEHDTELVLDPGVHQLELHAPEHAPVRRTIHARSGERDTLRVAMSPRDAGMFGTPLRIAAWSTLGGAAAFAIVATSIWYAGKNRVDSVKDHCNREDGCSEKEAQALFDEANIDTYQTWSNVAWVASGTALAAAGVLLVLDASSGSDTPEREAFSVRVSPRAVQLEYRF